MRPPVPPSAHQPASANAPATAFRPPTLFLLHFLGGSARTWDRVTRRLATRFHCIPIDLPGFGDAAGEHGYGVAEMADVVARRVRAEAPSTWALAGHSMGAKVATVLARRAEDGEDGLAGLTHLILVAGSPPGPEPMEDGRRETMMGWFSGDGQACRTEARSFIDESTGEPLPAEISDRAMDDVLRADRSAWLAWLAAGSREDWALRVGVLRTPALIVAGERDTDLGPDAQSRLMVPHCASSRLVTLAGAGHLLPLERAHDIARLLAAHVDGSDREDAAALPGVTADYAALIASDRVSARTRAVLRERGQAGKPPNAPRVLEDASMAVLSAVVDRVVPQPAGYRIDIAARIDADLASGRGDGWRFATLPPDAEAYAAALRTLDDAALSIHGRSFTSLAASEQDEVLERAAQADIVVGGGPHLTRRLSAVEMKLWFEDLRADAARAYVSHPATLARIGFGGIANGGDGERKQGYSRLGAGDREPWEPEATAGTAP